MLYSADFRVLPDTSRLEHTMATSSAVAVRRPPRFKYVLFSALGAMFLFVLWHNEPFIIDHSHPDWTYYFPVRWLRILHGLGGLTALLIGPWQLSSRFRQKHVRVHPIMGGFDLGGITMAALLGMYILTVHGTPPLRVFTYVIATTWLLCGRTAFASVMNANYQQHRQWMVRSYAVTTIFVTARVVFALPIIHGLGDAASAPVLRTLLVMTLILTELGLAWRGVFTSHPPRSAHMQAAGQ